METIRGTGVAPALVIRYVHRLPDTSLTSALERGGWEFFGWGVDRHIAAEVHDAIALNTEATGHWTKPPRLTRFPRPGAKPDKGNDAPKKGRTVAELFAGIPNTPGAYTPE